MLARLVAHEVVAELRAGDVPDVLDQSQSGLGRRRHIAFARRLIAAGDGRAAHLGRRYLLTREAIEQAREHYTRRAKRPRAQDDDAALARELGLAPRTITASNDSPDSGAFPKPGKRR